MQNILSLSRIDCVSKVWDSCSDVHIKKLISVHKPAVKVLRAASPLFPGRGHASAGQLPLEQHFQYRKCISAHKVVEKKSPAYLRQLFHAGTRSNVNSRNSIIVLPENEFLLFRVMLLEYAAQRCQKHVLS